MLERRRAVTMHERRKAVLVGGAALLLVVLLATAYFLGRAGGQASFTDAGTRQGNKLQVEVECAGWTSDMIPLGVFVSGSTARKDQVDEQLVFDGPGMQEIDLSAGIYEITPQYPRVMGPDGTVYAVEGPTVRQYPTDEGGADSATISYGEADMYGMDDEDLAAIAQDSFQDAAAAQAAFQAAKQKRDAAPAPPVEKLDDEGDGGMEPEQEEGAQ